MQIPQKFENKTLLNIQILITMYFNRSIQKKRAAIQTQPSKIKMLLLFRHPQKCLQTKETSENQSLTLSPLHSKTLV